MSRIEEQRQQHRFPMAEDDDVTGLLNTEGEMTEARVHDVSLSGTALLVPEPKVVNSGHGGVLSLHWSGRDLGEVSVDLVHVSQAEIERSPWQLIGVRFAGQEEPFLRDLCRLLVNRQSRPSERVRLLGEISSFHTVIDEKRCRRLLALCCRRLKCLQVFNDKGVFVSNFWPKSIRQDRLTGRFESLVSHQWIKKKQYCFVLPGFNNAFVFFAPLLAVHDGQAALKLPRQMFEGGIRRLARMPLDDEFQIGYEFLHPQIPKKMISKQLTEAGLGGMSFELDLEQDILVQGSVVDSGVLRLPDGRGLPCRSIIRHIFRDHLGRLICGLEILSFSANGRRCWVETLLRRMSPFVEEATPVLLDEAWSVFESSGYLEEKPTGAMGGLRVPFVNAWRTMMTSGGQARCLLYRTENRSAGIICISKIYSKTWLTHHLAVEQAQSPLSKLQILTDLIPRNAFQWLSAIHPEASILIYFNANEPFNRQVWLQFLEKHLAEGKINMKRLEAYDFMVESIEHDRASDEIWVREPHNEEITWISSDLHQRDGSLLYEALDYTSDRFLIDAEGSATVFPGMRRGRIVFVAGCRDQLLGYLVVEMAIQGVNIFALYNTCRIVVKSGLDQDRRLLVRDKLFYKATEHYRSNGCETFILLKGQGDMGPPETHEMFKVDLVQGLILSEMIPRWIEYLENIWRYHLPSDSH